MRFDLLNGPRAISISIKDLADHYGGSSPDGQQISKKIRRRCSGEEDGRAIAGVGRDDVILPGWIETTSNKSREGLAEGLLFVRSTKHDMHYGEGLVTTMGIANIARERTVALKIERDLMCQCVCVCVCVCVCMVARCEMGDPGSRGHRPWF